MNKLIAKIILVCHEEGVKLTSPYDLECVGELLSYHNDTLPFFYARNTGDPINPVEKAKEVLNER